MKLGFISSGALHLLVVLIVWLGLPHIKRDPPKLDELIFVKLADVAKVTNLPPDIDTQPKKKSKNKSSNTKQSAKQKRASPQKTKNLNQLEIKLFLCLRQSRVHDLSPQN